MANIDKLINRFKQIPSDFSYRELVRLLNHLGYRELSKGKTSGSRSMFVKNSNNRKILVHKPHGGNPVTQGCIREVRDFLISNGDL